ncbi:hypothetical protein AB3S75_003142 [Citrus x aurantiifolia]
MVGMFLIVNYYLKTRQDRPVGCMNLFDLVILVVSASPLRMLIHNWSQLVCSQTVSSKNVTVRRSQKLSGKITAHPKLIKFLQLSMQDCKERNIQVGNIVAIPPCWL